MVEKGNEMEQVEKFKKELGDIFKKYLPVKDLRQVSTIEIDLSGGNVQRVRPRLFL